MDMGNYRERDEILSSEFESSKITCSFLIPEIFFNKLKPEDRRRIGKNLEFLLKKFRNKILKCKRIHKKTATSLYQEKGSGLLKINVRIKPIFWEELTMLSRSHGVSNCFLYHLLLKWENSERMENSLPDKPPLLNANQRLILVWMIDFKNKCSKRMAQLLHEFPPETLC
ncbi:hypothetical protein DLM78_04795 [Leptospira stimsonii]|uniref:DUF1564 domain-containing protein n=2 Tax=Leptospira stimsonii TaxID=2202203 RepID=A0A8B3CSP1_9LEPT|nr:hypothetical protein DLM78_04795 [Leptospira stimsonii]